jgi:ATP-binding cassette subfamily B protein IrtA
MKKKSSLSRLFEYAGNYKYLTILSWVLSAVSAWIALVPFYYIWRIIKEVLAVVPDYSQAQNLKGYGWAAVGFALLSMIIYVGSLMCSHVAAFHVQAEMRSQMMHHIVTLPMGFMDSEGSGKIRKIINESSEATETYLAHQLPDQTGAYATPVGLLVLLLVFDWRLGLLSLIPVVAAFLIMGSMTGEKMQQKMKEYQNALEEMSSEAVEYVRGIPVVKTFGQSVFSFKRFQTSIKNYEKWTISYTKDLRMPMVLYTTIINAVFSVLIATAFFFTASDAYLLNLLFYIIITPIITVTLNKIMFASENQMIVSDALERIDGILDRQPLPETKDGRAMKDSSVTFENVSFRYENASKDALHQISLQIKDREHMAFVGPSGGGKTTLASLAARFFDTTEGTVRIGGVDVRDIPSEKLMEKVSFVFQDSKLLKMSIYDNVRMGKKDATREEVLQALKDAQCEDIIAKMPNGIDTVIGSKGTYVSGGEAQRLSIARAMLKAAPILILDEATAFADPDNEAKVQAAFSRLSEGKTVIMIAHRLSSVVDADRICVLKDGEIREMGTHKDLVANGGIYAHMWEAYNQSVCWKVGA